MKQNLLIKPNWLKVKYYTKHLKKITHIKSILRKNNLYSVCEEAACPNITECFGKGQVTFMILGNICTRNCSYCNVTHGRPIVKYDNNEPLYLARMIYKMKLKYVVITSVNRDDLLDKGVQQFTNCIQHIKDMNHNIKIEILVPDFKHFVNEAIDMLGQNLPHVFNHNLETVERLHKHIRPGGNYTQSLILLKKFKQKYPHIITKSGLMVGLGETITEIYKTIQDIKNNDVDIITIGQYLQPTKKHISVKKYISLQEFMQMKHYAIDIGFKQAICGPLIRSSYNAQYYSL
ncbi:lipoyl synthase [Enterobacteriaceae endosymbiont of Macroplea mutica]|uniref:lipoyl synthase n=1 Tax=Enterobacteriaceae endosymbiont of Macroplea mutica TaxID=2675791 RepID=UPI001448C710|nr:lipoyl synthase [Enterobacteriaceae endosymbiont of Macroplea mutica]QJC31111.1 lipoyl synthase [Enterobacteriaceae endosymbiont of Macroplea mutica]